MQIKTNALYNFIENCIIGKKNDDKDGELSAMHWWKNIYLIHQNNHVGSARAFVDHREFKSATRYAVQGIGRYIITI